MKDAPEAVKRPGKAVEKRSGGREEGTEREATKEPE